MTLWCFCLNKDFLRVYLIVFLFLSINEYLLSIFRQSLKDKVKLFTSIEEEKKEAARKKGLPPPPKRKNRKQASRFATQVRIIMIGLIYSGNSVFSFTTSLNACWRTRVRTLASSQRILRVLCCFK